MTQRDAKAGFTLFEMVAILLLGAVAAMMTVTVLGSAVMKVRSQAEQSDATRRVTNCLEEVKAAFDRRDFSVIDERAAAGTLVCRNGLLPRVVKAEAAVTGTSGQRLEVSPTEERKAGLRLVTVSDKAVELNYVLSSE